MNTESLFWLISTLLWTMLMSFYSTQEMACISFNKLRLEYYVAKKKKWALWLHELLSNPTCLFSTTLIGVNVALMASSECARQFYESIGLNPNWAPLTQVPFVLLFGELVPMFAARIYSEHMAKLGIPLLYLSAKLLSPLSRVVDMFFRYINKLVRGNEAKETKTLLSREELQKLIEESELPKAAPAEKHVNDIIGNIFSLRKKQAYQLMERLVQVPCVSTLTTVQQLRPLMQATDCHCIPIYHRSQQKIIGIVRPQDLLEAGDTKKVRDFVQDVSFVSESASGFEILKQLKKAKLSTALVLNSSGTPVGIISINDILEELFFQEAVAQQSRTLTYLEKSFPAEISIQDFNEAYGLNIDSQGCKTFAELIEHILGRNPAPEEELFVDPVEIIVKETSLFKVKTILIRSRHM